MILGQKMPNTSIEGQKSLEERIAQIEPLSDQRGAQASEKPLSLP
jgi:hypothetical protein